MKLKRLVEDKTSSTEEIFISSITGNIFIETTEDKNLVSNKSTFATTNSDIYVVLDSSKSNNLKIISANGNVHIQRLTAGDVVIDTSNCSVTLEDCIFNSLKIRKSNGKIELKSVISSSVDVENVNGNIVMNSVMLQNGRIISTNGMIQLNVLAASNNLLLDSINGKIECNEVAARCLNTFDLNKNVILKKTIFDESNIILKNGNVYSDNTLLKKRFVKKK